MPLGRGLLVPADLGAVFISRDQLVLKVEGERCEVPVLEVAAVGEQSGTSRADNQKWPS